MVTGKKRDWTAFCSDEAGTAALEYMIIVSSVGLVLAGLLSNQQWGVLALYQMIFNAIMAGNGV